MVMTYTKNYYRIMYFLLTGNCLTSNNIVNYVYESFNIVNNITV